MAGKKKKVTKRENQISIYFSSKENIELIDETWRSLGIKSRNVWVEQVLLEACKVEE